MNSLEKLTAARLAVQQGVSFGRQAVGMNAFPDSPPGLSLSVMTTLCLGLELCLKGTVLAEGVCAVPRTHNLLDLWKILSADMREKMQARYAAGFSLLQDPLVAIIDIVPTEAASLLNDDPPKGRGGAIVDPAKYKEMEYVLGLADKSFTRLRYFYEEVSVEKYKSFLFLPELLGLAIESSQETFFRCYGTGRAL